MTEAIEEQEARRFFEEGLGLTVTRVPSAKPKTPDFLIDGEQPGYVLEVKFRFDDENFLKELERGYRPCQRRGSWSVSVTKIWSQASVYSEHQGPLCLSSSSKSVRALGQWASCTARVGEPCHT